MRIYLSKTKYQSPTETMEINSDNILENSLKNINNIELRNKLNIKYTGDNIQNLNGNIKEWFYYIIKEIKKPKIHLFEDSLNGTIFFNKCLKQNEKNLSYFSFIGKIIAKALFENITINLDFNIIIYKMILEENITPEDLKYIDQSSYDSLNEFKKAVESNEISAEDLHLYYIYEYLNENNENIIEELIPGGKEILVNNIDDYILKKIEYIKYKYTPFIEKLKQSLFAVIFIFNCLVYSKK